MKALALKLLIWRTKRNLKRSASEQKRNVSYVQSNKVAIVFTVEDIFKHEAIKYFLKILEKDNKQITVLSFLPESGENYEFKFDYIDWGVLSNFGQINSPPVSKFVESKFDLIFHLDTGNNNPIIENILSQCSQSFIVGLHKNGKENLYDLMIKPAAGKEMQQIVDEVYFYTKELKKNDTTA